MNLCLICGAPGHDHTDAEHAFTATLANPQQYVEESLKAWRAKRSADRWAQVLRAARACQGNRPTAELGEGDFFIDANKHGVICRVSRIGKHGARWVRRFRKTYDDWTSERANRRAHVTRFYNPHHGL